MKPDGTNSFSTADEKRVSPEGNHFTEPDVKTGSEVKKCLQSDGTTWSYLFVHHSKVKGMEAQLTKDGRTYFVHKTIRYFKRMGKQKVRHKEIPTVRKATRSEKDFGAICQRTCLLPRLSRRDTNLS